MSMNAVFVQVEEFELKKIQADPSIAETLFEDSPTLAPAFGNLAKMMRERIRAADPKLLADRLAGLDPRLREQLEQRIGHTTADLASGTGWDKVVEMIEQRFAGATPSGAPASKHSTLSLEKEWHGVHFLLCGKVEPDASLQSKAVLGGTILGADDEGFSGYGPARYFTPRQVSELSQALSRPGLAEEAAARFDAAVMNKLRIYPGFRPTDAEPLMAALTGLRDFYTEAASKGRGIVTCLI
jgi:hypothetical protein